MSNRHVTWSLSIEELTDKLESAQQHARAFELERKEYLNEIAKLQSINDELKAQNIVLTDLQRDTAQDAMLMSRINRNKSTALTQYDVAKDELETLVQKQTKITTELRKENLIIKQQNEQYHRQLETLTEKLTVLERHTKNKRFEMEEHKQQTDILYEQNAVLHHQLSTRLSHQNVMKHEMASHVALPIKPLLESVPIVEMDVTSPESVVSMASSEYAEQAERAAGVYHRWRKTNPGFEFIPQPTFIPQNNSGASEYTVYSAKSPAVSGILTSRLSRYRSRESSVDEYESKIEMLIEEVQSIKRMLIEKEDIVVKLQDDILVMNDMRMQCEVLEQQIVECKKTIMGKDLMIKQMQRTRNEGSDTRRRRRNNPNNENDLSKCKVFGWTAW